MLVGTMPRVKHKLVNKTRCTVTSLDATETSRYHLTKVEKHIKSLIEKTVMNKEDVVQKKLVGIYDRQL